MKKKQSILNENAESIGAAPVLVVEGLRTVLRTPKGSTPLVDGVSFVLHRGETLGIVGESGSGKTLTALSIMRLISAPLEIEAGEITLRSRGEVVDLVRVPPAKMRTIRGNQIAMIFQDPMTSLNPILSVGFQLAEGIIAHGHQLAGKIREQVQSLLARVGIPAPAERANDYPHQFSGGMRQRIMVAMGLANDPAVIIADEPTTALDVTVQAQILKLIDDLAKQNDTGTLLITHNLAIVAQLCSRIIVMYMGRIVEEGGVDDIFENPQHPYTHLLLRAIPRLDGDRFEPLANIPGSPPMHSHMPSGCKFAPRCPYCLEKCTVEEPELERLDSGRSVRCWVRMENAIEAFTAEGATL